MHSAPQMMRVLVATARAQSKNLADFCEALEGELVVLTFTPGHEGCTCARTFLGLMSKKRTTTARVVERPMSRADVEEIIFDDLVACGEPRGLHTRLRAARMTGELLRMGASFPIDTIVDRPTWDTVVER